MQLGGRQLLVGLGLGAIAQAALAVGFGRLPSTATLGQPLQLSIPLRLEPDEELRPECLSGSVSFADNLQQPGTTSLRLDPAPPGVTDRNLRLATTTRVDEPVVNVEISIGCGARVVRRFTLFADPPLVLATEAPSVVAAGSTGASVEPSPAAAPVNPAAQALPPTSGAMAQAVAAEPTARLRAVAPPARQRAATASGATATAKPRAAAPRRPADNTARLRLTPIEPSAVIAAAATSAAASAAEAAATAASAAAAEEAASAASAAAAARRRVEELEASMKRLQAETASTNQQLGTLQSRLQRAEGDRYNNPLVYALVALIALLLGLVLWLWRQRQQEAEAHAWLVQAAAEPKPRGPATRVDSDDAATAEAIAFAPVPTLKAWVSKPNEIDGFDDTLAATRAGPASMSGALTALAPLATPQKREVSVEELIDLEQQAEFFVVLGQDTAAVDLLLGHLRSTAGNSPLPYLKLLEIYKRRGDRNDYEKLRERFNSRFNAYAPAWETDLQGGRSLDEYPTVIDRLQNLWSEPQRAMDVLQASLLRAEGGETSTGSASAGSFDLPAYRELMLLYSVARDRSEVENGGAVDLLLPIGDAEPGEIHSGVFERLLATTTLPAQPDAQKPLEIDLTLEDLEPKPPESGGERH
ncbi:hypothetical protein [uncultured Methylibium sp.]|uniref:type IV pilus assembly protein FimV n=1 Tax=uncultured Methylibium sp. TaxID=381093 RepID=UPI0025FF0BDE|nr:hypothetical protein [uncultured Methylibium sp.]